MAERNIEFEHIPLARNLGAGATVWSPLASGLLSGKYKPSEGGTEGSGRLVGLAGSGNSAFNKFTDKNWEIVAELEKVVKEPARSMAQVAVNWVVNRPEVASVLIGATKLHQLEDNLGAPAFEIPPELQQRLDHVSKPEVRFPYTFFEPAMQGMIGGGATIGDKPTGYYQPIRFEGSGGGTSASES